MVRLANISDTGKIVQVLSASYSEEELGGIYLYLSMKIRDVNNFIVLIDTTNSMCLIVERAGNFKCQFHIYTLEESRGSHVLVFGRECAKWIFENTTYTSFLSFVTSRHASLFIRKIGMKPIGNVEDAGGEGVDEVLYSGTIESISNKLKLGGS